MTSAAAPQTDPTPFAAPRRAPAWAALLVTAAAVALMAVLRLQILADRIVPIGYGVPLVAFLWLRDRRYLWGAVAAFAVVGALEHFWVLPDVGPGGRPLSRPGLWLSFALQMVDLVVIAAVVHAGINVLDRLDRRHAELESAHREVAAREEELARGNEELHGQAEELQAQAEELERQAEELRVSNEELNRRERMLRTLLALSRSLSADQSRSQTLGRVCDTLGQLLDHISASAILELEGDRLVVRCHHGFGAAAGGGLENEVIADAHSFAAIVMRHNRTAYIEDLTQRPDLKVPQPTGPGARRFVSVLAAPLRVAGRPVGTLEAYRDSPGPWAEEEVALIESLAAQTSVSLEAAELYQEVTRERRRLDAILRTAPVGVTVANADGSEIRMNPAAAMFGVPVDANLADEFTAHPWRKYEGGRELTADQRPIIRALREGREIHGTEVEVVLATGRRLTLLADAAPIRDERGAVVGAVATFADISAQKGLQRELDVRRREAEEANVRKTRFLAAVSHDIRTPANAISLLAELIRRASATPAMAGEVPELAQELHGSAMALVNLLGDVLDLARFDSGRVELTESEFSLADLLAEEHRRMQPTAKQKGLDLRLLAPQYPIRLRTDRIKLSRVINNLVGNAIKFTEAGEIRLEAEPAGNGGGNGDGNGDDGGGGAVIRVADTGIGIAPEHQGHIFDEFFQLRNPERDRNKGTGLGLTICKRLVDAMGGRLTVESEPGRGSTFTVRLPAASVVPHGGG